MSLPVLYMDGLRVDWEYLGEGYSGYYDENDPEDERLLRFTVYQPASADSSFAFEQVDDGSYCTLMPHDTPEEILEQALQMIADAALDTLENGGFKRKMEELSWMKPDWFDEEKYCQETGARK